jgi:hypothetical protein
VREIEHRVGRIIPWAFCLPSGDRIGDFRKVSASACCVAGVPGRLVHNFRRTAVRNLERAGVPRSSGMKLTGHKTLAVYARYAITDQGCSTMPQRSSLRFMPLKLQNRTLLKIAKVSGIGG